MSYVRLVLIGLGLLLAGAIVAQGPSLYQDLRFLHAARVFNEQQATEAIARQAAQSQPQRIEQSQVHPGVVPPTPSPPEKK